jgi:hypothetical protein
MPEQYFPWRTVQLWLRDGFLAGWILNKVMIASWPKEKRPYAAALFPEEKRLLKEVLIWVEENADLKLSQKPLRRLLEVKDGHEYPELEDEDARALWLILSQYGTAMRDYGTLHEQLRDYIAQREDLDDMVRGWWDGIWRSIGPALEPDRKNILEDH